MTSPSTLTPRLLFALLRWAVGAGLLFWVFSKMPMDEFREAFGHSVTRWRWWLTGIVLTWVGLVAAAFRWHGLLATQGVTLPLSRVMRIFFIGQFFNAFLPGACGGDMARAYYILRDTSLKRTESASTVLVDRGIGLFSIVVFACMFIVFRFPVFLSDRWTKASGLIMIGLLLGAWVSAYLFFRRNVFESGTLFKRLESATFLGPILRRVYNAFYVYRDRPGALVVATWFSLINLTALTLAGYAFGQSLGLTIPLVDYFTWFPIITVLSSVPITPGALGIRESLFAELFTVTGAGIAQAVPLSLMIYAGGLFWSLAGGVVFLGYSSRYGVSFREEWSRLRDEHRTHTSPLQQNR